jgi:hypothetical protein
VRLVDYPYVLVRLRCDICKRAGGYRLARLAVKFGADIDIDELVVRISADCPYRDARRRKDNCGAYLCDLKGPPRPPDLPPAMIKLRVVSGGRR